VDASDLQGREFDWFATDADGHAGLFSTAGGGAIPGAVLATRELHDAAVAALLTAPPTSEVEFAPPVGPGLANDWAAAAARGLFAFDSDPNGGPYRLVARPKAPAQPDSLPAAVRDAAATAVLDVGFSRLIEGAPLALI